MEVDYEVHSEDKCHYCNKAITSQQEEQGEKQIFQNSCFHFFHLQCFQLYFKQTMAVVKQGPIVEFEDFRCAECKDTINDFEVKNLVGEEAYQSMETARMSILVAQDSSMVKCECGQILSLDKGKVNYSQKDEAGKVLSKQAAEHFAHFRVRCFACQKNFCSKCNRNPYHTGFTCEEAKHSENARRCRFCQEEYNGKSASPLPAFKDVCKKPECLELMSKSCPKVNACGHPCCGIAGEPQCLPCLQPECLKIFNEQNPIKKISESFCATEFCTICYVSFLMQEPVVQTSCNHIFHLSCLSKKLLGKWLNPRITFFFLECPACKQHFQTPQCVALNEEIKKFKELEIVVKAKALDRAKVEGLEKHENFRNPTYVHYNNLQAYGMNQCAFYMCFKCKTPYFGGLKECRGDEQVGNNKPEDLICGKCAAENLGVGSSKCKTHGTDFIEFKCRFCCQIAQWFCWNSTHFCDDCHKRQCAGDYISKYDRKKLPQCKGKQSCPLKIDHDPNGDEFALGCSMCRNEVINKNS